MRIIGVDEVGRGSLAGPLVVGAVMLSANIDGLKDSKLLTPKRREQLSEIIKLRAEFIGLGWVSALDIDRLGLNRALSLAGERALAELSIDYDKIILDGSVNYLPPQFRVETVIKADMSVAAVSAASIVAKVARDKFMHELARQIPNYGFERNVGYGTAEHLKAIQTYGVSEQHRRSFEPIKSGYR